MIELLAIVSFKLSTEETVASLQRACEMYKEATTDHEKEEALSIIHFRSSMFHLNLAYKDKSFESIEKDLKESKDAFKIKKSLEFNN